ncbi:Two component system response regulator [Desulfonema limicola]|uniref:Two component system response regulator n=1 Tax=Desulfonema limicola TaxID=45656 RepID=A0A975BCP5_9BACT|nr:response regulator [Desulfonema limicola]QTA82928.1 Two component system response regulator [Desulfonema limicola]
MSVIALFSGNFCNEEAYLHEIQKKTGYRIVKDHELLNRAAELSGTTGERIQGAFSAKPSIFNRFTHEKERAIAHLRMALSEVVVNDEIILQGFSGHLLPKTITHVMNVCLISDIKHRLAAALESDKYSEKEALGLIKKHDEDYAAWIKLLYEREDPWDTGLYDIVIPTDKLSPDEAGSLIKENMSGIVLQPTSRSRKAVEDFQLAARVEASLAREGHDVSVDAREGTAILTINKHVLMLGRLEDELKSLAGKVPGVKSVVTVIGRKFHKTDIYRKFDFDVPSKVLLVDDEREFVQTLSERLMMRDMGSAVAYDGESAIDMVNEHDPEVMILDLNMPGIDGIEVLRRVKQTNPDIEVIILTGHGSEDDKKVCMDLGAFDYLQKPVDIEVLSKTLKAANEKIHPKQ